MANEESTENMTADEARVEFALSTIKDVLWRLEESCEGRRNVYEVLGYLLEDLIREGICPACINETMNAVFEATGADLDNHREDEGSVYH